MWKGVQKERQEKISIEQREHSVNDTGGRSRKKHEDPAEATKFPIYLEIEIEIGNKNKFRTSSS